MMRWLFRWAFRLLILVVVLVVAAILLLDSIAREVAEYRMRRQTGLEVKIGRMQIGLLNPQVTIENLVIYNSAGFGGSPLVDMPELHLEYDRMPWFGGRIHFKLIRLNLARVNVVRDTNGRKSLDVLEQRLKKTSHAFDSVSKGTNNAEFPGIDALNLTLGRVTYMDMKDPRKVQELKVEIHNQVFPNVKSAADLDGVLLVVLIKSQGNVFGSGGGGVNWLNLLSPAKKK